MTRDTKTEEMVTINWSRLKTLLAVGHWIVTLHDYYAGKSVDHPKGNVLPTPSNQNPI